MQTLQECFRKFNEVTAEEERVLAFFSLLPLYHRTLKHVVRLQHPKQRPLPFRYVIAVVSGIADALAAAAAVGVVHLDMKEDNVMVDDAESMDFEAAQRVAAPAGDADTMDVDYSQCIRRFERPPVAVVVDWDVAMPFEDDFILQVPVRTVDGRQVLSLPDGVLPWGNGSHASPELHIEWKRASDALERAKVAVVQAFQAKTAAVDRTWSCVFGCLSSALGGKGFLSLGRCCAGGDAADIPEKQARYDAAVAARDSITAVLDYRKQPSFEVGTMGFWMATGIHPCGGDYPARLPAPYDAAAYPTMPPSAWPSVYRELMTECVAFDPRDRPGIAEVAARLQEMRAAAWMSAGDVLDMSWRLVRIADADLSVAAMCYVAHVHVTVVCFPSRCVSLGPCCTVLVLSGCCPRRALAVPGLS